AGVRGTRGPRERRGDSDNRSAAFFLAWEVRPLRPRCEGLRRRPPSERGGRGPTRRGRPRGLPAPLRAGDASIPPAWWSGSFGRDPNAGRKAGKGPSPIWQRSPVLFGLGRRKVFQSSSRSSKGLLFGHGGCSLHLGQIWLREGRMRSIRRF